MRGVPALNLASQYVQDLRRQRNTGSATAETTFYNALSVLFNAVGADLKPKVLFASQLRNQGAGLPEGGVRAGVADRPGKLCAGDLDLQGRWSRTGVARGGPQALGTER